MDPSRPRAGLSRRAWLTTASGVVAAGLVKTRFDAVDLLADGAPSAARLVTPTQQVVDPTKVLGRPVSELGDRAPGEQPRRILRSNAVSSSSRSPLQDFHGIITPSDLHFERHHAGIPDIVAEDHQLLIHGMVDRPMTFSVAELKRFPSVSRICFIECSGNGSLGYSDGDLRTDVTPQELDGLLSTSEWTGVPLTTLLREVGVRDGASWMLAEGGDAAKLARSIPLGKALDDAMVVYAQNGEAVRPGQGYPIRLLLPGWEGNAQVKWLRRLEIGDQPWQTREETSKYTDPLPGGVARQFSFVLDAKSLITFPAYPYALPDRGWWEISGLAWSGRGAVSRVEVSTDGGRSWVDAEIGGPVLSKCPVRFRHLWDWDGRETVLLSRATDSTGYVQPSLSALLEARGAGTSYHWNNIRGWKVGGDGRVGFGLLEGA